LFFLCQDKGSLQVFQHRWSTEESKRRNGKEDTSKKDKATDRCGVEGAGVREVRKGGQVGHPGLENYGCTREDNRDEVKDSGG